jgi:hypothetical protein
MTKEQRARLLEHFASVLHVHGADERLAMLAQNLGLPDGAATAMLRAERDRMLLRAAKARGGEASTRTDCEP